MFGGRWSWGLVVIRGCGLQPRCEINPRRYWPALAVVCLVGPTDAATQQGPSFPSLGPDLAVGDGRTQPCLAGVAGDALCGRFRVYENRAAGRGRTVDLAFVVLEALCDQGHSDAVTIFRGGPGAPVTPNVFFSAQGLGSGIRGSTSTADRTERVRHRSSSGVGRRAQRTPAGYHYSVLCAEDIDPLSWEDIARETAATFMGDFLTAGYKRVCERWPSAKPPADYLTPVRSDKPTLMLSGARGPVTPVAGAEKVAAGWPNSLHVIVPNGGHGQGGPCINRLILQLIQTGTDGKRRTAQPSSARAKEANFRSGALAPIDPRPSPRIQHPRSNRIQPERGE